MPWLHGRDGYLNVVTRLRTLPGQDWSPEAEESNFSLARISLDLMGDGNARVPDASYRRLPSPRSSRIDGLFVGEFFIYVIGGYTPEGKATQPTAHALRFNANEALQDLALASADYRIESLDEIAAMFSSDARSMRITPMRLQGAATPAKALVLEPLPKGWNAVRYYYRRLDEAHGIAALALVGERDPQSNPRAAAVLYFRREGLELSELGRLDARRDPPDPAVRCDPKCQRLFEDARPIFVGERMFALLGYELVEGRISGARIEEVRRIDVAP